MVGPGGCDEALIGDAGDAGIEVSCVANYGANDDWDNDLFQQNVLISQVFGKALPFFVGLKVWVVLDPKAMFRRDARQRLDDLMVKLGNFCKEYRIGMRIIHSDL